MNSNTKIIMLLGVTLFFMLIGGMILDLKFLLGVEYIMMKKM